MKVLAEEFQFGCNPDKCKGLGDFVGRDWVEFNLEIGSAV
jgi:hypothetical protein